MLTRYFPAEAVKNVTPNAKFLDVILYSRNEIHQENEARGMGHLNNESDAPYGTGSPIHPPIHLFHQPTYLPTLSPGIMRVKAQDVDFELPMLPTTLIRNALGNQDQIHPPTLFIHLIHLPTLHIHPTQAKSLVDRGFPWTWSGTRQQ